MTRSRWILVGLVVMFTAPLGLATLFHAGVGSWFSFDTVNRGTLIDPPRAAPTAGFVQLNGERLPAGFLSRKWTMVYHANGDCASICVSALRSMRQAHRALGRDRDRVQRLLLVSELASQPAGGGRPARGFGIPAAKTTPDWRRTLADLGGRSSPSGIWIVDPRGFVVLFFAPDTGPRAIKDDLKRLLKYSKWQTG